MMPAEQPIPDRLYDLMSGLMPKWLTIMAERDGVGLNSEQLTITMSTCKSKSKASSTALYWTATLAGPVWG